VVKGVDGRLWPLPEGADRRPRRRTESRSATSGSYVTRRKSPRPVQLTHPACSTNGHAQFIATVSDLSSDHAPETGMLECGSTTIQIRDSSGGTVARRVSTRNSRRSTDSLVENDQPSWPRAMARATTATCWMPTSQLAESVITADETVRPALPRDRGADLRPDGPPAAGSQVTCGLVVDVACGMGVRPRADGRPGAARGQGGPTPLPPGERRCRPCCASTMLEMGQGRASAIVAKGRVGDRESRQSTPRSSSRRDDDVMDALHRQLFTGVCSTSTGRTASRAAIDITPVRGRLLTERYADHAVSVAHRVIYLVTGEMPNAPAAPVGPTRPDQRPWAATGGRGPARLRLGRGTPCWSLEVGRRVRSAAGCRSGCSDRSTLVPRSLPSRCLTSARNELPCAATRVTRPARRFRPRSASYQ